MIVWEKLPKRLQTPALRDLRGGVNRLDTILFHYLKDRKNITHGTNGVMLRVLSASAIAEAQEKQRGELAALKVGLSQKLAQFRQEVEANKADTARTITASMGRDTPKDNTEALLRETREARAWNRIKPILDREDDSSFFSPLKQIITAALTAGDDDAIVALLTELPAYAQGRGQMPEQAMHLLEVPLSQARPDVAAALDVRQEVEKGSYMLVMASNYVEEAVNQGQLQVEVPGYDGETMQTLTTGREEEGA